MYHKMYKKWMEEESMGKKRELQALPSIVDSEDGNRWKLEKLPQEEKSKLWGQLRRHMEKSLNGYYSFHPDEWTFLLKTVQKAEE